MAQIVGDRRDLIELYEAVCAGGYEKLRLEQRLEPEQNLLKSYLVEVHPGLALAGQAGRLHFLNSVLGRLKAEASPTNDATLFNVQRGNEVYHCDALHHRFWIFHSSAHATATDRFIDDLTRGTTALDLTWFPSEGMEALARAGEFLGFASEYDPRPLFPTDEDGSNERTDGLVISIRRFTGDATVDLAKLRRPDMFLNEIGLSSIRVRFGDSASTRDFALTDVTHAGKFTARGPSFSAHQALIGRALSIYENAVESIERDLAIRWEQSDRGLRITGSPIGISFRPYPRFDLFVERLFSGRRPFRLWGLPVEVDDGQYSVQALDLHVGSTLRFDVSNGFIRVYLPEEACGNTVTRLFTNIQRHIDSRAVLMVGDRTRAFGFAP